MISDVFTEAVAEIDRYLTDPAFRDTYQGARRTRILRVLQAMEDLRQELDTPPDGDDIATFRRRGVSAVRDRPRPIARGGQPT